MNKKTFRIQACIEMMRQVKGNSPRFLTLTTADKCTLAEVRRRWASLMNSKWWRRLHMSFVMVFEKHPGGHGWHIHAVISRRLDVNRMRPFILAHGFGRFQLKRMDRPGLHSYMGKYISKNLSERDPESRHIPLSNCSRDLCHLKDITCESDQIDFVKDALVNGKFKSPAWRMVHVLSHVYECRSGKGPCCVSLDYCAGWGVGPDDVDKALFLARCWIHRRAENSDCKDNPNLIKFCVKDLRCGLGRFTTHVLCDISRKGNHAENQSNLGGAVPQVLF